MWPRASSATTNRSNRWSCPTITFHLTLEIKQRTARIAGIHGGVNLNQVVHFLIAIHGLEGAVETGDNARAHGAVEAQGITDDERLVADVHSVRIAQYRGHELRRRLAGAQDGDVILRLLDQYLRARLGAIREDELNIRCVRHDVQTREDITTIVNNDTAPDTMRDLTLRVRIFRADENE